MQYTEFYSYASQFDKVELNQLFIDKTEIEKLAQEIPIKVKIAIDVAYQKHLYISSNTVKN